MTRDLKKRIKEFNIKFNGNNDKRIINFFSTRG